MGTGHSLAALSLASRFGAEEEGLHVLEGSGHPGAGKHIAKGWAEPHPPHITAESSRTPGCSSCHHPALSLHSASSVGPPLLQEAGAQILLSMPENGSKP